MNTILIKTSILLSLIFPALTFHAQNKKKQIINLHSKIDSMHYVSQIDQNKIDSLNKICIANKVLLDSVKYENIKLQNEIINLKILLNSVNLDLLIHKNTFNEKYRELDSTSNLQIRDAKRNTFEISDFHESSRQFQFIEEPGYNYGNSANLNGVFYSYYTSQIEELNTKPNKSIIYTSGSYKNGYKEGNWTTYCSDGSIKHQGNYKLGLKEGIWINYDDYNSNFSYTYDFNYTNTSTYLGIINIISDYYGLDLEITEEHILFIHNRPTDTLYYFNQEKKLMLKVSKSDGKVFFDNNQPLINQKTNFYYPYLIGLENKNIEVYNRNGIIRYKLIIDGNNKIENYYNDLGSETARGVYKNDIGIMYTYDAQHNIVDSYDLPYGSGKFGNDCSCY